MPRSSEPFALAVYAVLEVCTPSGKRVRRPGSAGRPGLNRQITR